MAAATMAAASAVASASAFLRSPAAASPRSTNSSQAAALAPAKPALRRADFLGARLDNSSPAAASTLTNSKLVARADCRDARGGRVTGGAQWKGEKTGSDAASRRQAFISGRWQRPTRAAVMTPFGAFNVMGGPCGPGMGMRGWGSPAQQYGLNRLFNELFNDFSTVAPLRRPVWNVEETSDSYKVAVELPGFSKEEVKVQLEEGNVLVIRAQRATKEEKQEQQGGPLQKMRRAEGFQARFRLAEDIKAESIGAELKNGVLNLTFPRAVQEKASAVDIPVIESAFKAADAGDSIDVKEDNFIQPADAQESTTSEHSNIDNDSGNDAGSQGISL